MLKNLFKIDKYMQYIAILLFYGVNFTAIFRNFYDFFRKVFEPKKSFPSQYFLGPLREAAKKSSFLSAPPPSLSGPATKKRTFFCDFPYLGMHHAFCHGMQECNEAAVLHKISILKGLWERQTRTYLQKGLQSQPK